MAITRIGLRRFTAFEDLDLEASPGVNVLVGANGTGKTHLMKAAYAACDISKSGIGFAEKLAGVFMPSNGNLGRLVKRRVGRSKCRVEIRRGDLALETSFSTLVKDPRSPSVADTGVRDWIAAPLESVFVPAKEILANAPGFRSLYNQREVHFEEIYDDILVRAYRPSLRGKPDNRRGKLLEILRDAMDGRVTTRDEEFFLRNKQGELEFSLLAEGMRKLGLLWLLIQNGTLLDGSVLFWDEPETNLNPKLMRPTIEILLELQRMGVQIFIATHEYAVLKELDLQAEPEDKIAFHSLYRDEDSGEIACHSADGYLRVHPNAIAEAFNDLYDRDIARVLRGMAA